MRHILKEISMNPLIPSRIFDIEVDGTTGNYCIIRKGNNMIDQNLRVYEIAICKIHGSPYYNREFLVTGYVKGDGKSLASLMDITKKTGEEIVGIINNPTPPDLSVEMDVLMDRNSFIITGGVRV